MKLSTRLALGTATLVFAATTAVGFFAYRALESSIYPAQLTRMAADAQLMTERLSATVVEVTADVSVNANAPALHALIRAMADNDPEAQAVWKERLGRLFRAGLEAKPEYVQLRFIALGDGGREVVRVDRSASDGSMTLLPDSNLQAKGHRPYFTETVDLGLGAMYVSPIELNQEFDQIQTPHMPVLRVATAVPGPGGGVFGIVIANVDLRPAFDRLRAAAGPDVVTYVVNARGDYLVHPDRAREFGFDLGRPARLQDDFPELWDDLSPGGGPALVSRTVEDAAGAAYAAAASGSRLAGETWVATLLLAPRAVVLAPADAILYSVLGAGAAAIAVAVLLSLLLARNLARPLAQLAQSIEKFDRGETAPLPASGPAEVKTLVDAFRRHIERERLFSAAVQSSNDAIATESLDGIITAWNAAAERLYGYSAAEAVGMPVRHLVPDDCLEDFESIMDRLHAGRATNAMETYRLTKGGRRVHVSLSVSPVRSLDGKIVGASKISRDITEQKRAEAMVRMAVNASPAAMIMVDGQGQVVLANAETQAMFGYDHDELIGRPVEALLPERYRGDHPGLRGAFFANPHKRMMGAGRDLYGQRRDGTEFPVEVGLSPIDSPDGRMVLSVVVDITERRRAVEELERRTEELQRSNAELQQWLTPPIFFGNLLFSLYLMRYPLRQKAKLMHVFLLIIPRYSLTVFVR
jgi:PAS domain S-box-containing protein